jgi:hypothetical protein
MENQSSKMPLGDQIEHSIIKAFGGTPKPYNAEEPMPEPTASFTPESSTSTPEESVLRIVANLTLISGILLCLFLLLLPKPEPTALDIYQGQQKTYDWMGIISAISIMVGSLSVWAFLRVIANISDSLKAIAKTFLS